MMDRRASTGGDHQSTPVGRINPASAVHGFEHRLSKISTICGSAMIRSSEDVFLSVPIVTSASDHVPLLFFLKCSHGTFSSASFKFAACTTSALAGRLAAKRNNTAK